MTRRTISARTFPPLLIVLAVFVIPSCATSSSAGTEIMSADLREHIPEDVRGRLTGEETHERLVPWGGDISGVDDLGELKLTFVTATDPETGRGYVLEATVTVSKDTAWVPDPNTPPNYSLVSRRWTENLGRGGGRMLTGGPDGWGEPEEGDDLEYCVRFTIGAHRGDGCGSAVYGPATATACASGIAIADFDDHVDPADYTTATGDLRAAVPEEARGRLTETEEHRGAVNADQFAFSLSFSTATDPETSLAYVVDFEATHGGSGTCTLVDADEPFVLQTYDRERRREGGPFPASAGWRPASDTIAVPVYCAEIEYVCEITHGDTAGRMTVSPIVCGDGRFAANWDALPDVERPELDGGVALDGAVDGGDAEADAAAGVDTATEVAP